MGELVPMPRRGDLFSDVRGDGRVMRVSCHDESGMIVLSLWADRHCRASFRLDGADVPRLLEALGSLRPVTPSQRLDPARQDPADLLSWDPSGLSVSAEAEIGEPEPPRLPRTGAYDVVVRPISPAPRDPGQWPPAAAG
ncbi:hypothetical protein [Catenuloplanes indicus]|uniref:Laminin IV type B domain-containing protein n=1 Tax=Catenuloplanes indicus TaxID=137267 RepID=A0AAE3VYX5_9ACTN|nr:hypothetical protein [Catenuloplanes indicus]MDQ0365515.1 hypothetical protein [Catenuloplanes indicus]